MTETSERPMTDWSDDQLLAEFAAGSGSATGLAGPSKAEMTEEILRRGLELPDSEKEPGVEAVEWGGDEGREDPGSGALPKPF